MGDALYKENGGEDMRNKNLKTSEGIFIIVNYVKEYQDVVRGMADFSYDMFSQDHITKTEELADLMLSEIKDMRLYYENSNGEKERHPYDCVNYWKNKKIEWESAVSLD